MGPLFSTARGCLVRGYNPARPNPGGPSARSKIAATTESPQWSAPPAPDAPDFPEHAGSKAELRRSPSPTIGRPARQSDSDSDTESARAGAVAMRALVERGRFITDRTLTKYIAMLPTSFGEELLALGASQHWVDMGAGFALSQAAYGAQNPAPRYPQHQSKVALEVVERLSHIPIERRATTTAISYRPFETHYWWGPSYLTERPQRPPRMLTQRFEDVSDFEVGRADLITDVFGIFAYAEQPDAVLRRYVALLEDTGSIYIYLGPMEYARRSPVTLASGEEVNLADWLTRQRGLHVELLDGVEASRNSEAVAHLQKTPGEVPHITELVLQGTIELTSPPHRRYREKPEDPRAGQATDGDPR